MKDLTSKIGDINSQVTLKEKERELNAKDLAELELL